MSGEIDKCEMSDGYHTLMVLFSIICNVFGSLAWKSLLHSDGTMFNDYFVVGISTPAGSYSYHFHKDHWDMFRVPELDNAPKWDGHMPSDIDRLLSLL